MILSTIFDEAANRIEQNGWWNGDYQDISENTECAGLAIIGAIRNANDWRRESTYEAERALCEYLGLEPDPEFTGGREWWMPIPKWNDAQDALTVIEALRGCAEKQRIREAELVDA